LEKIFAELAARGEAVSVLVPKANGGFEQLWRLTEKGQRAARRRVNE
jgi:hypothetical protein